MKTKPYDPMWFAKGCMAKMSPEHANDMAEKFPGMGEGGGGLEKMSYKDVSGVAKAMKGMGYEPDEEPDDKPEGVEKSDPPEIDTESLLKSIRDVEAAAGRTIDTPDAEATFSDAWEAADEAVETGDGTELLKSLISGNVDAVAGLGTAVDEVGQMQGTIAVLTQASAQATVGLTKSVNAQAERLDKLESFIERGFTALAKALNAPAPQRAVTAAPVPRFEGEGGGSDGGSNGNGNGAGITRIQATTALMKSLMSTDDQNKQHQISLAITSIEQGGALTPSIKELME